MTAPKLTKAQRHVLEAHSKNELRPNDTENERVGILSMPDKASWNRTVSELIEAKLLTWRNLHAGIFRRVLTDAGRQALKDSGGGK